MWKLQFLFMQMNVLSELFDNGIRREIANKIKQWYPYASSVVGKDRLLIQDGGVIIFSKLDTI